MKIQVQPPHIDGDRVLFRWSQTRDNPFQSANEFSFRYEGIDLARFNTAVFYEIFLALQLKVFAAYDEPVELEFSQAVSKWTFAYWQAHHGADRVTAIPLRGESYSPWRHLPAPGTRPETVAVFFGGGKDSMATTCLFSEIYGPGNVVLIQYVAPIRPKQELARRLELRQESLMLKPARERLGVSTQRVFTDYQSNFLRSADAVRPEIELYVGGLPLLLDQRVPLATFSYEWTSYPVIRQPDGSAHFHNWCTRPEALRTHHLHFLRTLGLDLAFTNINLLFSSWASYRILAERYPHALDGMASCTLGAIDQRWCYDCRKCVVHGLFTIFHGSPDPRIDYERLFGGARFVQRIVDHAATGVELSADGNAPYDPILGSKTGFQTFCHVAAGANPAAIEDRLSATAYANLITLKAMYGNRSYPHIEQTPTCVVPRLGFQDGEKIAAIVGQHLEPVPFIAAPLSIGNELVEFGLNQVMPTRTGELPHIRDEMNREPMVQTRD